MLQPVGTRQIPSGGLKLPSREEIQRKKKETAKKGTSVWVFAAVAAVAVLGVTLTVRRRMKQTR
jgi:hypothetical protein